MTYFAQKNYPEALGTGHYTIASAGCFLTAFCNQLLHWGQSIDPPTLNNWFIANGVYLLDSDGADEDLTWGSVTRYASNMKVSATGGASTPVSNDAIVKFAYNSVETGQPITHFCKVDHVDGNQVYIVDSWDGLVKSPAQYQGLYHAPIAWATYTDNTPAPPTPPPLQWIAVVKPIPGYNTSADAMAGTNQVTTVAAQDYVICNEENGSMNVTEHPPAVGYWINPADNVIIPVPATPSLSTAAPATSAPNTALYTVVVSLNAYGSAPKALTRTPPVTATLDVKDYYIFNRLNGMMNLTDTIGVNKLWWINPADNVVPVIPKPVIAPFNPPLPTVTPPVPTAAPVVNGWKSTYKAFNRENLPVKYTILADIDVEDYSGVRPPVLLDKGDDVWVFGIFDSPNGIKCGRLRSDKDPGFKYFFGVPMVDMRSKGKVLTVVDYIDLGFQKVMDIIKRKV